MGFTHPTRSSDVLSLLSARLDSACITANGVRSSWEAYRVIALGTPASGNSAASNTASVTTPTPPPALNRQAIFNANCTGCHGLSTATGTLRTQAQLATWIRTHNNESSFTVEQAAAVAAYIKP